MASDLQLGRSRSKTTELMKKQKCVWGENVVLLKQTHRSLGFV